MRGVNHPRDGELRLVRVGVEKVLEVVEQVEVHAKALSLGQLVPPLRLVSRPCVIRRGPVVEELQRAKLPVGTLEIPLGLLHVVVHWRSGERLASGPH